MRRFIRYLAVRSPDRHFRLLVGMAISVAVTLIVAGGAIAVEDSPNGVAAARAAGIFCVAVPGPMTRGLDFPGADLMLDSLALRSLDQVLQTRDALRGGSPR